MTTIEIPSDVAGPLAEAARQRNTTPEELAVASLRGLFAPRLPTELGGAKNLHEFMKGYIGTVDGPEMNLSDDTGKKFTDLLIEKREQGKL